MDFQLELTLTHLRECAELYRQLATARRAQERGASRAEDLAALDAEHVEDRDAARLADRQRRARTRRLEDELKAIEGKLQDRRSRQSSDAATVLALASEIAALRRRRDELEQHLLAAWQSDERAATELAADEAQAEAERERIARRWQDQAAQAVRAERAVPEIEGDLAHEIRQLPARIANRLERVARQVADPVADLVHGACAGCGHRLTPQEAVDVDREAVLAVCQGCGRYVVARCSRKTR